MPEGIHLPGNYLPEGIPSYEPCTYPSAPERERLRQAVKKHEHRTVARFERAHRDAQAAAPKHHLEVPEPIDLWEFGCQTPRGVAVYWHWSIQGPYRPHFDEDAAELFPFVRNDLERLYLIDGDAVTVLDPGGRGSKGWSTFSLGTIELDGDGSPEIVWMRARSSEPRSHATSETLEIAWGAAPLPLPEAIRGERWDGKFELYREGDTRVIRLGDGPSPTDQPAFIVRGGRFVPWTVEPGKRGSAGACESIERERAATVVGAFAEHGADVECDASAAAHCGAMPEKVRRLHEALVRARLPPQDARRWTAKLFRLDERTLPEVPAPQDAGTSD